MAVVVRAVMTLVFLKMTVSPKSLQDVENRVMLCCIFA